MTQSAVILSPEGTELTKYERRFFQKIKPFGFILFERNCKDKDQIKSLIIDLRKTVRGNKIFIFIDQEGGTVKRLKSSNWFNLDSAKFTKRRPECANVTGSVSFLTIAVLPPDPLTSKS